MTGLTILAETDAWQIGVGAFFAVIWLIGTALSALSKSKKEKREREALGSQPLPASASSSRQPQPISVPPPMPSQRKAQQRQRKAEEQQRQTQNQQRRDRARRDAEAAAQRLRAQFPGRGEEAIVDLAEVAQRVSPPPRGVARDEMGSSNSALRGGLASRPDNALATELRLALRPKNVKYQFVLNELLRPPLALRDEQES